jgi:hypothetical protein
MINTGALLMTSAIETVITTTEKLDQDAAKRPIVYGKGHTEVTQGQEVVAATSNVDKLKVVTGELLDLWLYEGSKSLEYIKQSQAYKLTDPYVNYVAKFEQVKDQSLKLTSKVQQTVGELNQQFVVYYDEASKFVGMLIKVVTENQGELIEYIRKTYSNVTMYVHQNWLRLDFNNDGKVDYEDVRVSLQKFYEFLKNYDYIQTTQKIRSAVYTEAKRYLNSGQQDGDEVVEVVVDHDDIPVVE